MYTQPVAEYMAKLYWRIKKNLDKDGRGGYWTWIPADVVDMSWSEGHQRYTTHVLQLEEE